MDFHRPSTPRQPAPQDAPFRAAEIPVSVIRFSERLRHLPLGIWAELSERIGRTGDGYTEFDAAAARRRLRQIADGMPSSVTRVRGRILELVSCAEGFFRPDVLSRMKKVALTAALALAVRPHLAADEFARLYEPFSSVIPLDDLFVAPAAGADDHAVVS
ncbi:MAG TPA: hypothetical protein VK922_13120 [Gemmatimonadaceae bacterium]|nr:hypothetical protein [Gemmatimonadaceae bacterium]